MRMEIKSFGQRVHKAWRSVLAVRIKGPANTVVG